jgi:dienelactone hydrolase
LKDLLGDGGPAQDRVVIAGFSQGTGVAIDTAVEEPRVGGVASFSPCLSVLRSPSATFIVPSFRTGYHPESPSTLPAPSRSRRLEEPTAIEHQKHSPMRKMRRLLRIADLGSK